MAQHSHIFPISKMAKLMKVSTGGYYRWLGHPPSRRSQTNKVLLEKIRHVWEKSQKVYGSPRIHNELVEQGCTISRAKVARLMRTHGITSQLRKKWVVTTDSNHNFPIAENVLDRRFNPEQLSQVWVSDITYLPSKVGWLYLTMIMDLGDRQIVGWNISKTMSAQQTTLAALNQALQRRVATKGMILHSDQGVQYACGGFRQQLQKHGIVQSMSRKGDCWDNAPAESFFKTLKSELIKPGFSFENLDHARRSLFGYIHIWYNRKRAHSTLGYRTPAQTEQQLLSQQQKAA